MHGQQNINICYSLPDCNKDKKFQFPQMSVPEYVLE